MRLCVGLFALGLIGISAPAMADTVKYAARLAGDDLNGGQAGAAKGSAAFTLDTASKTLTWTIEYSGLAQPANALRCGSLEAQAGPSVVVTSGLASPIKGSKAISDTEKSALSAGHWVCVLEIGDDAAEIGGEVTQAP